MSPSQLSLSQAFRLDGRRMLITGAAGGIGAATARACFALGAAVLLTDRESCEDLSRELVRDGAPAPWLQADIAEPATPDRLRAWSGDIDALILASGIYRPIDWDSPDWDSEATRAFEVNLKAPMHMARAFAPGMAQRRSGRIVLIGSVAGHTGGTFPGVGPHYGVTKGGIHTLVRYLAARYTAAGILVNGVAPGTIDTPMLKDIDLAAALAKQPMQRAASPYEVALPVAFLCSGAANFIAGAVLDINGGNFVRP